MGCGWPARGALQGAGERTASAEQMELARLRAELARVKMERDILKNDGVLCQGVAVKYAWIFLFRAMWPITSICEVLNVSVSG